MCEVSLVSIECCENTLGLPLLGLQSSCESKLGLNHTENPPPRAGILPASLAVLAQHWAGPIRSFIKGESVLQRLSYVKFLKRFAYLAYLAY